MSDHWLHFIPEDPLVQPTQDAADRAVLILRALAPGADEIASIFYNKAQFIDPGGNFQSVACPHCGTDARDWWRGAMDSAYQRGFADLIVTAPCCGARVSLNDLDYDWPAGFARYRLGAMNANIGEVSPADLRSLSDSLGLRLRLVRQRV